MHSDIEKFWKCFGDVFIQTEPNKDLGLTNVPIYWFDRNNSAQRLIVAALFNGVLLYRKPSSDSWVIEKEMLKIIKMKAFL